MLIFVQRNKIHRNKNAKRWTQISAFHQSVVNSLPIELTDRVTLLHEIIHVLVIGFFLSSTGIRFGVRLV